MPPAYPRAVISGFVEEVNTYLPTLFKGVNSLKTNPHQNDLLEEVHRLVHTIKGAAAMLGITGLSCIAFEMEETLEEIIAGKLTFDENVFQVFHATLKHFETYCRDMLAEGVNARELFRETALTVRRVRGLVSDENDLTFKALLESVPEKEGGEQDSDDEITMPSSEAIVGNKTHAADKFAEIPDDEAEDKMEGLFIAPDIEPPKPTQAVISPEFLATFYGEAEELLDNLGHALNTLDSEVDAPMDISPAQHENIREIRRYVHTLKGAAASIGFQDCASWAHHIEDLLDWMYSATQTITPQMVAVLSESADLLTMSVDDPSVTHSKKANQLKKELASFFTSEPSVPKKSDFSKKSDFLPDAHDTKTSVSVFSGSGKTLRIETLRVDELVNLVGELIIAGSGFDQKMELFKEALYELELARERLRNIARDMEIGYEVKALENLGTFGMMPGSTTGTMPGQAGTPESLSEFEEFDTLELDRYSQLNLIIRTLNESTVDVGAIYAQLTTAHSDFEGNINRQRVLLSELQDKTMRIRMTPMAVISNRLRRTIREMAGELNKKVRLIIEGEDIELDRQIWEKIIDPLMHLLRNAVDHGIESAEIRKTQAKPEIAVIKLTASREGNQVAIRVQDDGAGLNYPVIREVAMEKKLTENVDLMDDEELNKFIFQSGFSTCREISTISGRGVGMDVVRENIRELKGVIRIASEQGRGTEFIIRIPLTLAAVRALLFSVKGRILALPLNDISEIMRIKPDNIVTHPQPAVRIGDEVLPFYYMASILNIPEHDKKMASPKDEPLVLIINSTGQRNVLVIDHLIGQREIVIKSTGSHLRYVKGISGVTIMGDGSVVPILNIDGLLGTDPVVAETVPSDFSFLNQPSAKSLEIMIVDDSVSIRQVVSRLMEDQGWSVQTAKDGIDALEKLRDLHPDLIVLDIEMPRMNGYEFINALKAQPGYGDIPVVMLTSRTTAKHREKATALGVKGFIVKPYNDDDFINLITEVTS
ncbi:response regulator [Desulfococcaceae bacterium HSG9]|nr:response regulator [Desulfococcaceae bacterium HSG9]